MRVRKEHHIFKVLNDNINFIVYISSINPLSSLLNKLLEVVFLYFRHISILTKGGFPLVKVN